MYYEVYIDVVFLTNLIMDYILLRLLKLFLKCPGTRFRAFLGALAGALGACVILVLPTDNFLPGVILMHGFLAVLMVKIGCGVQSRSMLLQAVLALYFTAFLCGGFWDVMSADGGVTLKTFLLFSAATYAMLTCWAKVRDYIRMRKLKLYNVNLSYQGKVLHVKGFYDTGNQLTDLGSGKPVSITSWEVLSGILPDEVFRELRKYQESMDEPDRGEWRNLKPHFLTFQSVGNPSGMVLAMTLDEMCICTEHQTVLVHRPVLALPKEEFLLQKDYQIILNSQLLEQQEV